MSSLTFPWIAFHHLVTWAEASFRDLSNREILMESFVGRNDRGVCRQGKVNSGKGHEVCLIKRKNHN